MHNHVDSLGPPPAPNLKNTLLICMQNVQIIRNLGIERWDYDDEKTQQNTEDDEHSNESTESDDTPSISGTESFFPFRFFPCAHQMSLSSLKHVRYLSIGRSGLANRSRTNKMKFVKSSCVFGIWCSINKHPNELNDWLWHGHHSTIFLLQLNWTQINYPWKHWQASQAW